ncbi:hypothetical protein M413DRAFT_240788 [Hebeloma cylindrosporum]|uniref:Uncharacterized protein n=1 Tax=Hebeloma cylindrosporum TaxID=76867 RepID=A0A0C3C381_HEBCY|nr:hypothetical protein M413DRAFT_240788 [Hebeloma cylindrosporum h7]
MSHIYIYADSDLPASADLSDLLEDMGRHLRQREHYICASAKQTWPDSEYDDEPSQQSRKSSMTIEIIRHPSPPTEHGDPIVLAIDNHDSESRDCDANRGNQDDATPLTPDSKGA